MAVGVQGDLKKTSEIFSKVGALTDEFGLSERSIGMSDDIDVAIDHGSTMLRIGRVLFGERAPKNKWWPYAPKTTPQPITVVLMFKKLMLYLGLGPDEAYEEFMDNSVERRPLLSSGDFLEERGATENDQIHSPQSSLGQSSIRPLTPESSGTVRPLQPAATSKPHHVEAKVFDDAVEIGDRFLAAQPVVIDFQGDRKSVV